MKISPLVLLTTLCWLSAAQAKTELQLAPIQALLAEKKLDAGIAVADLNSDLRWQLNPQQQFPLMSVMKFPLALLVLQQVDAGKLQLEQPIKIQRKQLMQNTWSPLLKDYPASEFSLTVRQLLQYSVSQSDNNACDLLFELVGGPAALQQYLQQVGIGNIQIQLNEAGLHQSFAAQYKNWLKPSAAVTLLKKFYDAELLSSASQQLLWDWMLNSSTGANRLKAGLPAAVQLIHKTGTSSSDGNGLLAAVNDIGIVQLPDGRAFAIVVLITNSYEDLATNERLIAQIQQQVYQQLVKVPVN